MSYKCAHFLQLITVPQGRSEQCKQLARILQYNQSAAWPLVDVVQVACAAMGLTTSTWLYVYVCVSTCVCKLHLSFSTGFEQTCADQDGPPCTRHAWWVPNHVRPPHPAYTTPSLGSFGCDSELAERMVPHCAPHSSRARRATNDTTDSVAMFFPSSVAVCLCRARTSRRVLYTHTYTRTHSYQCCQTQSFKIG